MNTSWIMPLHSILRSFCGEQVPVDRNTAAWNMPFPALFRRLKEKTRGRILDLELGIPKEKPSQLTEDEWERFVRNSDVQEKWIDYWV